MSLLSRIAGYRCLECGALLPYFRAEGARIACLRCGAGMRIMPNEKSRVSNWIIARIPNFLISIGGILAVVWLFQEPRKSPQLTGMAVLALTLGGVPAVFVAGAYRDRFSNRIERAGD